MDALKTFYTKKFWWVYLVLGILITLLGVFFVVSPLVGLAIEVLLIEVLFLVAGIGGIVSSIMGRKSMPAWGASLAFFIILTILGIILLCTPGLGGIMLVIFTTAGFLFSGINMIVRASTLKGECWGLTLALGIIVTLAALSLMGNFFMGLGFTVVLQTISIIAFGISCITLSVQIKDMPL